MKLRNLMTAVFLTLVFGCTVFAQTDQARPSAEEAEKVWQMIERGETQATFDYLIDLYRANGAGINVDSNASWRLTLSIQDYKEVINSFSNAGVTVNLSRMVQPVEAKDYWENWSKTLAAGKFDHQRFFKSDRERFLMANFNVLVLASHEIGHYLDYRYQINDRDFSSGFMTDKAPLNCTENYADKFAVATVNYLAQSERFAPIRARYLELIKNFNGAIPAKNRYNFPTYDYVGEKCGAANLKKNGVNADGTLNENFFRQYASAYFNRHRLMLENDNYPPLAQVIKNELFESFYKRMDYADVKLAVRTITKYDGNLINNIFYNGERLRRREIIVESEVEKNQPISLFQMLLNDRGELRHVRIDWTAREQEKYEFNSNLNPWENNVIFREREFTLDISANPEGKITDSFKLKMPENLPGEFMFSKILMPTDDELLAVMTPFSVKEKFNYVGIVQLIKKPDGWYQRITKFSLPDLNDADEIAENWFITPNGKLNLLRRQQAANSEIAKLTLYEIEREDFEPRIKRQTFSARMPKKPAALSKNREMGRNYYWYVGAFGNDAGRILLPGGEKNLQLEDNANLFEITDAARSILGNLDGIADGDNQRKIQISSVYAARFINDNRAVFIDSPRGANYVREIIFR